MPSLVTRFPTPEAYAGAATAAVADALRAVLESNASAVLAAPGGSTARAVLPVLVALELPWRQVAVTLTDEHLVPLTHTDSNEAMLRSLIGSKVEPSNIFGLYDGTRDARAALPAMMARLPHPDVILFGMGEDGHIASLFSNDDANFSEGTLALSEGADHARVTLTPKIIAEASALPSPAQPNRKPSSSH